jgi:hypothetical protein
MHKELVEFVLVYVEGALPSLKSMLQTEDSTFLHKVPPFPSNESQLPI